MREIAEMNVAVRERIKTPLTTDERNVALEYIEEHKARIESGKVLQVLFITITTDGDVQRSLIMTPLNQFVIGNRLLEMVGISL